MRSNQYRDMTQRSAPILLWALLAGPAAHAAGDPVKGETQFGQCTACHTVVDGGAEIVGPNLFGVIGKAAATRGKTFDYSPALKASGIVWTDEKLDLWIKSPATLVPGTKMEFVGVSRPETRSNIIAYLKSINATANATAK